MHTNTVLSIPAGDASLAAALSEELGISEITAQILINRGMTTLAACEPFLAPSLEGLADPFSFAEMRPAVDAVRQAIREKSRILVFGDYDVDGVTSVALIATVLRRLGADVVHYIPHRVKEGYGLAKNIAAIMHQHRAGLLITADCGTNSFAEIAALDRDNLRVIVTDHHEPSGKRSELKALALINPKVEGSGYPFRELAGVGVAYRFAQALTGEDLHDQLDIVALGTIADAVPLTGENRIIAKEGLARIAASVRPGLKTLIQTSGLKDKEITAEFVNFILGPRINAAGRVDTAEAALRLMMTESAEEALALAEQCEAHNRRRQKIESQIMQEAQDLIGREVNFKEHTVMVVAKEGWHLGVLGIVAAKLADRFYRPAILISKAAGECRGSGRSIKNFHLFEGLLECSSLLTAFGGHQHAVGMVIDDRNIEAFRERINSVARKNVRLQDLLPSIEVDMRVRLGALSLALVREFASLEPFGCGNPEPLLYTTGLKLKGEPRLMGRDTIKAWLTDGSVTYPAIGFGMGSLKPGMEQSASMDIVYTPRIDTWQGQESMILELKEVVTR